jgi:uracil-DNA glycosylase
MRERILAVVEELKRRKAEGEMMIHVEADTLDALREAARKVSGGERDSGADAVSSQKETPVAKAVSNPVELPPVERPSVKKPEPAVFHEETAGASAMLPPPPIFTIPEGDKRVRWEWLRDRVINCPVCNAHLNPGRKVVFGNGNIDSPIFFCGEAPGADEEEQGIPFVGKAGQLLVKIIGAMGLKREEVYIGNIMNWRPQTGSLVGNRPPTDEEMAFCLPYLKAQVAIVQPRVIVALGNTALKGLLGPHTPGITSARGRWFEFEGTPLMPTFHPSYVLRYGNDKTKRQIWEDMLAVMEKVGINSSERQRGFFMPKSQETSASTQ